MAKKSSVPFQIILGLCLGGLVCYFMFSFMAERDRQWKECEERGGTFIPDRGICLDAKRIPLSN